MPKQKKIYAPCGWTVVYNANRKTKASPYYFVYPRGDCPAPDDLVPFTFPSRAKAVAAGKAGHFAYKDLRRNNSEWSLQHSFKRLVAAVKLGAKDSSEVFQAAQDYIRSFENYTLMHSL